MTIYDAKNWVFDVLVTAKTNSQIDIDGSVYMDKKPDSETEDIVVNAITGDSEFWQTTMLNVNCYVPDLEIRTGGTIQNYPNNERLEEIANQVYEVIRDVTSSQEYRFYVETISQFQIEEEKAHYVNFRVRLHAVNY